MKCLEDSKYAALVGDLAAADRRADAAQVTAGAYEGLLREVVRTYQGELVERIKAVLPEVKP